MLNPFILLQVSAFCLWSLGANAATDLAVGQFTFDTYSSTAMKQKCQKLDATMVKKLKGWTCSPSNQSFAGETAALLSCKDKAEKHENLIYATAKNCDEARENESANGDD